MGGAAHVLRAVLVREAQVAVQAVAQVVPVEHVGGPAGAQQYSDEELRAEADEVVCLRAPFTFQAVGQWYDDFSPTTDEEIWELLARGSGPARPGRRQRPSRLGTRPAGPCWTASGADR